MFCKHSYSRNIVQYTLHFFVQPVNACTIFNYQFYKLVSKFSLWHCLFFPVKYILVIFYQPAFSELGMYEWISAFKKLIVRDFNEKWSFVHFLTYKYKCFFCYIILRVNICSLLCKTQAAKELEVIFAVESLGISLSFWFPFIGGKDDYSFASLRLSIRLLFAWLTWCKLMQN